MSIRISDMPIYTGRPPERPFKAKAAQDPPFRRTVTGDPDLPPMVKAPSLQPHRPTPRLDRTVRPLILALVIGFTLVAFLDAIAPHDYSKPVNPAMITDAAVTGEPCGYASPIVSATEINSSGPYRLFRIVCADGVPMLVAR